MQQSTKFSKPNGKNGKRSRQPLPMRKPDELTIAISSPNDRPRKKCQTNSGGPAVRRPALQHPLVRFDSKENLVPPRPPLRRLGDIELESPGSTQSQPDTNRRFNFESPGLQLLDERSPQNLREMRETASQQQQSLSWTGSDADFHTPQDQPVKKKTDMLLKEEVENQRISHQSRTQHKKGTHSLISEALPSLLPPNHFYSIYGASSASERQPSRLQSSSRMYNEFTDVRKIGDGAFGAVYRARSRLDGSTYSIKKIRKGIKSTGLKELAYVLREVHALSYLQLRQPFCPHVLRYFSSWIQDDHLYIQTEFCGGGPLSRRLTTGKMSEIELREICRQMSLALLYLHSNGVAHLDVKPENILESAAGSGSYRLADFGLCTPVAVAHQDMPVIDGDSRYISQELLNEDPNHVDKGDVFALGASLLELSLGEELPRSGDVFRAIRLGRPPSIDASVAFNELLRSMMHPHAESRPSAQTILNSLDSSSVGRKRDEVEAAAQRRIAQLEEELRLSKQHKDVSATGSRAG